jgi:SAM-dependent methyltransferase
MSTAPKLQTGSSCVHPANRLVIRFDASDYVTGDAFRVARCSGCGLDVTTPAPAAMGSYYPVEYYGKPGARRFPFPIEQFQRVLYGRRARTIERLAGSPSGRVLDVGCGPGFLLQAFRQRGWQIQGTELSESAASRARSIGIPVHVGPVASWPWPDGHFDAVTLWHVLEHWEDPATVLDGVARVLRPGGVAMVSVPNFDSAEATMSKSGWFHLDLPRHLVHFTPESLERVLAPFGFEIRSLSFGALEYDTFSFVQSVLNCAGIQHNLLYNLLRGREAKLGSAGAWLQTLLTSVASVPLGAIGLPVTALLNLARAGSTVTVHAIRRDIPQRPQL